MQGIIEHLNSEKGYGFIKSEDHEKNLFFHARDLIGVSFDSLNKGDAVSFEDVVESDKGLAAKMVRIVI